MAAPNHTADTVLPSSAEVMPLHTLQGLGANVFCHHRLLTADSQLKHPQLVV